MLVERAKRVEATAPEAACSWSCAYVATRFDSLRSLNEQRVAASLNEQRVTASLSEQRVTASLNEQGPVA
ncbi:hypothetical protein GM1_031_00130 [Gordonia malaquae NBRC 108250]|uniref:Uncharacterized protein n=1 Tax=Gordonia malaquae NBRC 108250 TaxID=1223542 RepID=M3UMU6_GORML|nr:hypothetical protein GM1_031_00130 [Gordonia malaquae NBRC 108250]